MATLRRAPRRRRVAVAAVLALAVAGLGPAQGLVGADAQVASNAGQPTPADAAVAPPPTFVPGPCPFALGPDEVDGETVRCGRLTVPESRAAPTERTVSLQVAVVAGQGPDLGAPIVVLEGGPGGSATAYVPGYWTASALRAVGDLVVFDQRGTGFSTPSLDCWEWYLDRFRDPTRACRSRLLRSGLDLTAYSTAESAADVLDLIAALGLNEVRLYGISYGSRLALTVLRARPQEIGAVLLEGVYPPQVTRFQTQARVGYAAMEAVIAACAADAACDRAYPDLGATWLRFVPALDARPLVDGDGVLVTGADAYRELEAALYVSDAIPYVPALIAAAARGDGRRWTELLDAALGPPLGAAATEAGVRALTAWLAGVDPSALAAHLRTLDPDARATLRARAEGLWDDDAEGAYDTVECAEEVPFNDLDVAWRIARRLPPVLGFLTEDVADVFDACAVWRVPRAPAAVRAPVTSDVPMLLLSGAFDPVTPPAFADAALASLANAHHVVFPFMGHGVVDLHPCPTDIALAFLAEPDMAPDTACVATMDRVPWALR